MALQHIRSSTLDKRPQPASLSDGQLAINTNLNAPGVFFKDSNGALVKVGPTFVGTTAPNSTPGSGGATGNTLGEQWLDTSGGTYVLKIWDGTAWRSEAGEFVNVTGDTMTGALVMDNQQQVRFRETTANGTNYIALQAPASVASDKTITLPDVTGTVVTTGDTGSVTSTMIADGTILNADVNASAAIAGTKISPDFGSQNVTTTGTVTGASLNPTSSTVPTNGVYLPAANSVGISTNGTGRLFINSSGSVGIGTSSPSYILEVRQDSAGVPVGINMVDTNASGRSYSIRSDAGKLLFRDVTGSADRITLDSSGRVGIGTTTVNTTLEVVNSSTPIIRVGDGARHVQLWGGSSTQNQAVGTATAASFGFNINSSEVARFDTSGRLLVGTSTARPVGATFNASLQVETTSYLGFSSVNNTADIGGAAIVLAKSRGTSVGSSTIVQNGDNLGEIIFAGADGTDVQTPAASILAQVDGTPGANDMPGRLVFSTTADGASSPTERMRITSVGNVGVGNQVSSIGNYGNTGVGIGGTGFVLIERSQNPGLFVNRTVNDGELVQFAQDNNQEGSITVSGTTVSYNGAHLSRWSQLPSGAERTEILRGSVLSNIDEMCEWGDEENEQLNRMKVSEIEGDKNVAGVFQAWDDDDDTYTNDFYCAMTGDFIIRIAQGVTVQRGDLLMSAGDGTAKPQDDDIIRSKTIAKVTSTNVTCTYEDGSYCVPCVLMAC